MKIHVQVEMDDGSVLEFTEADIIDVEFSTPFDIEDVTPPDARNAEFKLGAPRFKLVATFPEWAPPCWREVGREQ